MADLWCVSRASCCTTANTRGLRPAWPNPPYTQCESPGNDRAFTPGHASTVRQTCRTASGWHRQSVATDIPEIASSKYIAWENISREPKFHVLPPHTQG